jgi:CheY-like chemotaxis protein
MRQRRKMILCIDDNTEVLKSLRFQLRQSLVKDIRIILAEGSEDALKTLEVLNLSRSDMLLIVSDWLMPNINGEDLIKMIEQRWGPIMTIVLSGHITPEAKARLSDLDQVISVMNKPWSGEALAHLITQSLLPQTCQSLPTPSTSGGSL